MKKISAVSILLICVFLCSCIPLKKSIVSRDGNETIGDTAKDKNNNIILRDVNEKLRDESPLIKEPDIARQENPSENEREKSGEAAQTEKTGSSKTTEPVKPETAKPELHKVTYDVKVDISDQKVYVYKDSSEIKTMTCSTGVKGHETPEGIFKIRGRGDWFFSEEFQQGGKYWVGFIGGTYLFHSVPADRRQRTIEEEASKLGMPASHGCVRLSEKDAKWFFDTIPDGSKVTIQK